jgi:tetratricopeptide (TPR) repeat protein
MADTGWKCKKCSNLNLPTDKTCSSCGAGKPSPLSGPVLYVVIGGAVFLLVAILFIIYMGGMPERNYKAAVEANIDKATGQITQEGNQKLADLQKEYEISNDKATAWKNEVIAKTKKPEAPVATKPELPPQAAQPAQSADELKKLSAELNFQQGMNYVQSEDYGNAIMEFTAAIDKFPNYAIAYSNRAVAYMQQKKFNLAADDLKKASELSPTDPNIYYNLAALYSLEKKLDLSLRALDKALELGFNNYDSLRRDPDLKNLRKDAEYRHVLEKHKVFLK